MISRIKRAGLIAAILLLLSALAEAQQLQKIIINFPTRSGTSWPLFIAKEGGYYRKYSLDVNLVFAGLPAGVAMVTSGEAQMSSYSLDQQCRPAPAISSSACLICSLPP